MPASEYSKNTDRTTDVQTSNQTPFSTIVCDNPELLKGLTDNGFVHASPIQVSALPTINAGSDTIVEAKNGTGKTLTFVIPVLKKLKTEHNHLQSIVLAPTREIAVQIQQCFKKVGQYMSDLKCEYFIGGTSVDEDKLKAIGCQIAVGSPGRIKHLLTQHVLIGSNVKSFILDEVDRMLSDKNFTNDIRSINAKLPKLKQTIVVSASIDKSHVSLFDEFMEEYSVVKDTEENTNVSQDPTKFLLGIKQYVACVKSVSTNIILLPAKNLRLLNILRNLPHTQCIIFTNYMTRVEAVCNMLRDNDYKADYIRGDQDQKIRLKLVDRLTSFKSKILVATDLIARGIDSSNVDLIINMDCPHDSATYLHRIGRAGRFGNRGYAVTILDDDKELISFKKIINSIENVSIKLLPIAIKKRILDYKEDELEELNLKTGLECSNGVENGKITDDEDDLAENGQSEPEINSSYSSITQNNQLLLPIKTIPINESQSIYGSDMSVKESLVKLREIVSNKEKQLIDNNLVNKKHLTADRSFVLFDPEPLLDDTDQYMKYSAQELVDIFNNYDSDISKYEASKKLINTNEATMHVECAKEYFSQQENSNDISVTACANDVIKDSQTLPQKLKFTNIFDLFQIPDISLIKPTLSNTRTDNSTKENYDCPTVADESEIQYSRYYNEEEYCDDEEEEWVDIEEEEEEDDNDSDDSFSEEEIQSKEDKSSDYDDEVETECYTGDETEDENQIETEESDYVEYVKPETNLTEVHTRKKYYKLQKPVRENENNHQQLVNRNVLNDWYREWHRQLNAIQTYVNLS